MDPKGTAKSKRSQTLHGRKNSPHTSFARNADKKNPEKQQKPQGTACDNPRRPTQPSLPSNWDRYEEEYGDSHHEGEEKGAFLRTFDDGTAVPKSKGADFVDLVEKARSRVDDDEFKSRFDVSIPDYIQDFSPLLLTRGDSLMTSIEDNFFVDDEVSPSFEVPFLAFDMDALSKQLSKLKTSQRLFIEPMYITEEKEQANKVGTQKSELKQSSREPQYMQNMQQVSNVGYSGDEKNITDCHDNASTSIGGHETGKKTSPLFSVEDVKKKTKVDDVNESQQHAPAFGQQINTNSKCNVLTKCEIASVEGELDLLLDSFSVKPFNSSDVCANFGNNSVSLSGARDVSSQMSDLQPVKDYCTTKSAYLHTVAINTTVDDLLADVEPIYSSSSKTMTSGRESTIPSSKFSRSLHGTVSIDETIDDLLEDTLPYIEQQKQSRDSIQPPTGTEVPSSDSTVITSPSVTKPLHDFDSWFDSF